jgi:hypothetical protein
MIAETFVPGVLGRTIESGLSPANSGHAKPARDRQETGKKPTRPAPQFYWQSFTDKVSAEL